MDFVHAVIIFPLRSETSHLFPSLHPAPPVGLTSQSRWPGGGCASATRSGGRARGPRSRRWPVRPYVGDLEAFRLLLTDQRFWGLPMCLETPKSADCYAGRENLARPCTVFWLFSPFTSC
jgi:hypothetical protein